MLCSSAHVRFPHPKGTHDRLRLVVKNLLNLLQDLRGELLKDIERLQVVDNLIGLGGTELMVNHSCSTMPVITHNTSRDVLVDQSPGQSQVSGGRTKAFSDLGQFPDLLDLGLALGCVECLDVARHHLLVGGVSTVLGDAIVVFTSQQTGVEGRPNGRSATNSVEDIVVFNLESLSVHHGVVGLLDRGADETETGGDLVSLLDLCGRPLRGTPVEGLALCFISAVQSAMLPTYGQ